MGKVRLNSDAEVVRMVKEGLKENFKNAEVALFYRGFDVGSRVGD